LAWKASGTAFGINFDEIEMKDLNDFATFNEFFTRKLKPNLREISRPNDN
jgi:phosphatidylserine decarboxylase